MTAYPGPETLEILTALDRETIHTALIEAARRDALTPMDLLKDKRWILASKLKRHDALDEEELGWIVDTLIQRAERTERTGMVMNPVYDRVLAELVAEIKRDRETQMINQIRSRYNEKTACSEQTA